MVAVSEDGGPRPDPAAAKNGSEVSPAHAELARLTATPWFTPGLRAVSGSLTTDASIKLVTGATRRRIVAQRSTNEIEIPLLSGESVATSVRSAIKVQSPLMVTELQQVCGIVGEVLDKKDLHTLRLNHLAAQMDNGTWPVGRVNSDPARSVVRDLFVRLRNERGIRGPLRLGRSVSSDFIVPALLTARDALCVCAGGNPVREVFEGLLADLQTETQAIAPKVSLTGEALPRLRDAAAALWGFKALFSDVPARLRAWLASRDIAIRVCHTRERRTAFS